MSDKVRICETCGNDFIVPEAIKAGRFFHTGKSGICFDCYDGFAKDSSQCFGKKYSNGKPLAGTGTACAACPDLAVCGSWSDTGVRYVGLGTKTQKEKVMSETETVEATSSAAPPKVKRTSKPKKAAPATKKGRKVEAAKKKTDGVPWGASGTFREGTSAALCAEILLAQKSIKFSALQKEFEAVLKKSGVKCSNPLNRIVRTTGALIYVKKIKKEGKGVEAVYLRV